MYSSGKYSQEEIEALKHCLKYEGWQDNDTIPKGWKIRRGKKRSIHLLEQGGKNFCRRSKHTSLLKDITYTIQQKILKDFKTFQN